MKLDKARSGQRKAITKIIEHVTGGVEKETSIILPTGYGKTDVMIASAIRLWDIEAICCSLVISPDDFLRQQIVNDIKFYQTLARYFFKCKRPIKYRALKTWEMDFAANGECLLSTTNQLIQGWLNLFTDWINSMVHRHGIPVLAFIDETHTNSVDNKWGKATIALRDAGAHIVPLTATGWREDNAPLVGFDLVEVEAEPVVVTKTRPGSEPTKVLVQIYEGTKRKFELHADHETTYKDAWNEGVLCQVTKHTFDVDLSIVYPEGHQLSKFLSELNESDTRKHLGKIVRHPQVIREGCRIFLDWLNRVRSSNGIASARCAGIIFCGSDTEDDDRVNEHAKQIRDVLKTIAPKLKVVIATSANDREGDSRSGKDILEEFSFDDVGDILIVKAMAGLGLDAPRVKCLLDLSPVRSANSVIQRIGRALRPYNGIMQAHYIVPADILAEGCFYELIESQGGATTSELNMMEEYEIDKKEEEKPFILVSGISDGNLEDTKKNLATHEDFPRILVIVEAFPSILASMTLPEIAEKARMLLGENWVSPEAETTVINTGNAQADLRDAANIEHKKIVAFRFIRATGRNYTASGTDQALWGELAKQVWNEARGIARITHDLPLKRIGDLLEIEKIRAALDTIKDREVRS